MPEFSERLALKKGVGRGTEGTDQVD